MFAALGTKVTVIEQRDRMLDFCDEEIVEALQFHLRSLAVTFRFRETVEAVEPHGGGTLTTLASGKVVAGDVVMYSAGRQGATDGLGLEDIGITPDKRGRIQVDEHFRTNLDHIYAVGDVVGFPALASTSMEQGRLAAYHAFDEPTGSLGPDHADRHLHDPGSELRGRHRGPADRARPCPMRWASPGTGNSRGARSAATRTGC